MSITESGATTTGRRDEGTAAGDPGADELLEASFAQERLWFLDRLSTGGGAYLLAQAWRVRGPLDRRQ